MKWMLYILIVATITAHYHQRYLDWSQRNIEDSMRFTLEMMKHKPILIHPLEEK